MHRPQIRLISFSQNGEDIVLERAFRSSPAGFYVDLGAGHPIRGSVTKILYDQLGWYGIDVEPTPHLSDLLRTSRSRSTVVRAAAAAHDGTCFFSEFKANWAMSTTDEVTASRHRKSGLIEETHHIPCMTLNSILQAHQAPVGFELLKVDIEGSELSVLRAFDFNYWRPAVILVETTVPGSDVRVPPDLFELMQKNGYKEVLFDGINSFFLNSQRPDLRAKLEVCANSHDQFVPLRWWRVFPEEFRKQYADLFAIEIA